MKPSSKLPCLALILCILVPQSGFAACVIRGDFECPAGQSLNSETCACEEDPVPELSTMAIPAALGLAGYFALRARKKASKEE